MIVTPPFSHRFGRDSQEITTGSKSRRRFQLLVHSPEMNSMFATVATSCNRCNIDYMMNFVNLTADRNVHIHINDLPLFYLRDSLVGRRWNRFSQIKDITDAIHYWHQFRTWIPHDSCELSLSQAADLIETHPPVLDVWTVLQFPAGVPAPAPPALFFLRPYQESNRTRSHLLEEGARMRICIHFHIQLVA